MDGAHGREGEAATAPIEDRFTPGEVLLYEVRERLFEGRSPYQQILIADLVAHGRTLFLDGALQSAERDERVYHEALVQPGLLLLERPARSVLILGGGEGATLREALRHRSVERAVMVDLDGMVVDACRRFLPGHHAGAFDDPRADVRIEDAAAFCRASDERFDLVVFDIVDPQEEGPAAHLFEEDFLRVLAERVAPGGVVAFQYGPAFAPHFAQTAPILRRMARLFPAHRFGRVFVPSFHGTWGMALLARDVDLSPASDARLLDRRIEERLDRPLETLDGASIGALYILPRDLRSALEGEDRTEPQDGA